MILDVNNDDIINLTTRLERVRKVAVVYAVRSTVNDMAFDTRKGMLKNERKKFTIRQGNFFRSRTQTIKAKGTNVNSMFSETGIFAKNNSKREKPVFNLEQQEEGGVIKIGNIPTNNARVGGLNTLIAKKNRLQRAKVRTRKRSKFKSKKARGTARAYIAHKTGKLIVTGNSVYRVTGFHLAANDKVVYNKELLYHRNQPNARLPKKAFVGPAGKEAGDKAQMFYNNNVQFQLNRIN